MMGRNETATFWSALTQKGNAMDRAEEPADDLSSDAKTAEERILMQERAQIVQEFLAKLGARDRAILLDLFYHQLDREEVCARYSVTREQIAMILVKARKRFRRSWEHAPTTRKLAVSEPQVSHLIEDPIIKILMTAAAAFQKVEIGRSWLLTPNPSLGNVAPLSIIKTPEGREMIANELGLIEHGMF
jgi:hypothetical protein